MVSAYYAQAVGGEAKRPCEIASLVLSQKCCDYTPPDPPPAMCRKPGFVQDALAMIDHLAGKTEPSNSFDIIVQEIAARRPLCSSFQFFAGPLHYLLVVGFDVAGQVVSFVDPADGRLHQTPHSDFVQNTTGHWTGWIFTR